MVKEIELHRGFKEELLPVPVVESHILFLDRLKDDLPKVIALYTQLRDQPRTEEIARAGVGALRHLDDWLDETLLVQEVLESAESEKVVKKSLEAITEVIPSLEMETMIDWFTEALVGVLELQDPKDGFRHQVSSIRTGYRAYRLFLLDLAKDSDSPSAQRIKDRLMTSKDQEWQRLVENFNQARGDIRPEPRRNDRELKEKWWDYELDNFFPPPEIISDKEIRNWILSLSQESANKGLFPEAVNLLRELTGSEAQARELIDALIEINMGKKKTRSEALKDTRVFMEQTNSSRIVEDTYWKELKRRRILNLNVCALAVYFYPEATNAFKVARTHGFFLTSQIADTAGSKSAYYILDLAQERFRLLRRRRILSRLFDLARREHIPLYRNQWQCLLGIQKGYSFRDVWQHLQLSKNTFHYSLKAGEKRICQETPHQCHRIKTDLLAKKPQWWDDILLGPFKDR